jgi:tetratricopeptide (TPR) repeat protein
MPTQVLIDEMREYAALQQANMQQLVRFGELRDAGDLVEAAQCGSALEAALRRQIDWTAPLNEKMAIEGGEPLAAPQKDLLNVMLIRADLIESLGLATDAVKLREAAMELAQNMGGAEFAERQRQLAGSLLERGRIGEAFSVLMSARDLFKGLNDKLSEANCIVELAGAYEWLRDFDRALEATDEAKKCLDDAKIGERSTPSNADAIMGLVKKLAGEANARLQAFGPLDNVLDEMLRLQDTVRVDSVLSKLMQCEARCKRFKARSLLREGQIARAQALFNESRTLFDRARPLVLPIAHPALDFHLAGILVDAGENGPGLEAVERLEPLFQSKDLQRKLPTLLELKAQALQSLNRPNDALGVIEEAEDGLGSFDDPDQALRCARRHDV